MYIKYFNFCNKAGITPPKNLEQNFSGVKKFLSIKKNYRDIAKILFVLMK